MNVSARPTGTPLKALLLLGCVGTYIATSHVWALETRIPATTSGDVFTCIETVFEKHYGTLNYGGFFERMQYVYRAFLKFNLDQLPDSCHLLSAELGYYQTSGGAVPDVGIVLIPDPDPLDAESLYWAIQFGEPLTPADTSPDGWVVWQFRQSAIPALDSCRRMGWASFGVYYPYYYGGPDVVGSACGYNGAQAPYLRIEYTVSGTCEPQGTPAKLPELAFAPNPASGRFVTVQYGIAAKSPGRLKLRDVTGRTVKSFTLDPSGSTRLDLRGFAPGVHMATLDAAGQSISRKLILTAQR